MPVNRLRLLCAQPAVRSSMPGWSCGFVETLVMGRCWWSVLLLISVW